MRINLTSSLSALAIAGVLSVAQTAPGYAADETEMAKNAKVTIGQAVEAAEQKGMGKATEAEFEDDYGGRWEVKVLSQGGDKLTKYFVDPNSGEVTGQEEQTFEKYWTMLKPADFQKAQTQLKEAIAAAEKAANGKATSAEVERSGDAVAYEIDVATADGSKDVDVDANGKAVVDD
ncbi:PepSY domain-containing protein [Hansschlegelia sp.]|uniref:PepSY domain-containing protein n=1 Tax=Hansschlegelia sp. TaxID=2041892 RepID=UPI002CEFFA24|nr:PepSY domain-containing protein [Hansschlegelia sp.]HVI29748.1 PepSY domain-containing protein [Hansschlegelia sp.]